jgi:hypothetical protein
MILIEVLSSMIKHRYTNKRISTAFSASLKIYATLHVGLNVKPLVKTVTLVLLEFYYIILNYLFLLFFLFFFASNMSSRFSSDMDTNTPTHCFHNLCQVMLDGSSKDLTKKNIEDFRVILHIIMHECSKANIEVSFYLWVIRRIAT